MAGSALFSLGNWLEHKTERWSVLNIVMLTILLVFLGPDSWLARILGYGAVLAVGAWRLSLAWESLNRDEELKLANLIARWIPALGMMGICLATAAFALEFADKLMSGLAWILFAFQLYFFRLFSGPRDDLNQSHS